MAREHRYSLAYVCHLVASAALFFVGAVGAAAVRAVDAFVAFALSASPPRLDLFAVPAAPRTSGQPQTRAFRTRLLARVGGDRQRAPLSGALVTAL
jgi:hypothetical protein